MPPLILTGPKGWQRFALFSIILTGPPPLSCLQRLKVMTRICWKKAHPDLFVLKREYNPKRKSFEVTFSLRRGDEAILQPQPGRSGWRAAIIDSIDDMNKNGVNALLKLIEELLEKLS